MVCGVCRFRADGVCRRYRRLEAFRRRRDTHPPRLQRGGPLAQGEGVLVGGRICSVGVDAGRDEPSAAQSRIGSFPLGDASSHLSDHLHDRVWAQVSAEPYDAFAHCAGDLACTVSVCCGEQIGFGGSAVVRPGVPSLPVIWRSLTLPHGSRLTAARYAPPHGVLFLGGIGRSARRHFHGADCAVHV